MSTRGQHHASINPAIVTRDVSPSPITCHFRIWRVGAAPVRLYTSVVRIPMHALIHCLSLSLSHSPFAWVTSYEKRTRHKQRRAFVVADNCILLHCVGRSLFNKRNFERESWDRWYLFWFWCAAWKVWPSFQLLKFCTIYVWYTGEHYWLPILCNFRNILWHIFRSFLTWRTSVCARAWLVDNIAKYLPWVR